jgi:aconitate hydratase
VAGKKVSQVVIGSSANPGYRDFWIAAEILKDKQIDPEVSLDINPSSRQTIQNLSIHGNMADLIGSGARFHQTGCMGCIGMGQSPATGQISLRTMPRNFPGRSGTVDDQVYLCSPETAVASALTGKITVPKDLENLYKMKYPKFKELKSSAHDGSFIIPPTKEKNNMELSMGPNIKSLPEFGPLLNEFQVPVLLKMGDNISTDEILKAGAEVLPLRSNIPEISKYTYKMISNNYYNKSMSHTEGHVVVAGDNYAQGSSREHAAIAPRFLGQCAVIAKSYARIGWQNLINFGIIPFEFEDPDDYGKISDGDKLSFKNVRNAIASKERIRLLNKSTGEAISLRTTLSDRQTTIILAGGVINHLRAN